MATNSTVPARYTGTAQALHWIIALTIFGMFTLGLLFESIPRNTRQWWINLHTVTGLFLFALVLFRLFWRIGHKPLALPEGSSGFVRASSAAVHHTMYLLMIAIPVSGIIAYIWHAKVFDFGLFQLNFGVPNNKSVYDPAEQFHKYMGFVLMGLVALHFLAAIWHQLIKKDGLLLRMMPGGR